MVLSRPKLANELRRMCDSVRRRLWIASPYVGSWSVRNVLGRAWWNGKVDVRLLTDPAEQVINRNTAERFMQKGCIKKLRGIHAKLYVVDDRVLLTSANLTYSAFARRHEVGFVLKGDVARSAIALFESWWKSADIFTSEDATRLPSRRSAGAGEDGKPGLPAAVDLPPDPGDFGAGFVSLFDDYVDFLKHYRNMARIYQGLPRLWPRLPLYLETDAFLDFLYHNGPTPSKEFKKKPRRKLAPRRQRNEILRYARKFQARISEREEARRLNGELPEWKRRLERHNTVKQLLSPNDVGQLDRKGIKEVARMLNCMNDRRVLDRFLRSPTNTTDRVKRAWATLLHSTEGAPTEEMTACASSLFGFKRSSVQELMGWYQPNTFPLRNQNVNAGMRFLGYDVRAD
jgi:phospholipase D-like protein